MFEKNPIIYVYLFFLFKLKYCFRKFEVMQKQYFIYMKNS